MEDQQSGNKARFSFDVITKEDGSIRVVNPQCDDMSVHIAYTISKHISMAVDEYNAKHRSRERDEEIMKQMIKSFPEDIQKIRDSLYLSPIPETAAEIEEQCIFL